MGINFYSKRILKLLGIIIIIPFTLFEINAINKQIKAEKNLIPANEKDLDLYRSMGITYICTTSDKGNDLDFEKSLVVAANLFTTVVQQKHGGFIKEGKKEKQKVMGN